MPKASTGMRNGKDSSCLKSFYQTGISALRISPGAKTFGLFLGRATVSAAMGVSAGVVGRSNLIFVSIISCFGDLSGCIEFAGEKGSFLILMLDECSVLSSCIGSF